MTKDEIIKMTETEIGRKVILKERAD